MKTNYVTQHSCKVMFELDSKTIEVVLESEDNVDIIVSGEHQIGVGTIDDALTYLKQNYGIDDEDVMVLDKMLTHIIESSMPLKSYEDIDDMCTAEDLLNIARDSSHISGEMDYMRQNIRNLVNNIVEEMKDSIVEDITTSIDRVEVMETVRDMCRERIMSRREDVCREVQHQVSEKIVDLISDDFDCELENMITDDVLVEVATNIIKEA